MSHASVLPLGAFTAAAATALLLLLPEARGDQRASTIAPEEIKEGMKGYGLTVFKGTRPERFDVEVVGVLRNFRPSQDLILIKTPHPRLNVTKNVKGMSGSPIYLDGRLAGAYAYSWAAFQVEPVAGVTPIAPMLAELRRPIPPGYWPLDGRGPLQAKSAAGGGSERLAGTRRVSRYQGEPGSYDLLAHRDALASRAGTGAGGPGAPSLVSTPLMLGGLGARSTEFVRELFGPLGFDALNAGGGGGAGHDPDAPLHYENGGALGVAFVSGDVSMFGLGTVTQVEGHKAAGFGHPMMEFGNTALPAAIGRVHWIFASEQHSSKIGEAARFLGTLVQDRQSAVVVDENVPAPTFPMTVKIKGAEGAPKTDWSMQVALEPNLTPGLVASALSGALDASLNENRDVTWKMLSTVKLRGKGELKFEDVGLASGGMPAAGQWRSSRVVRAIGDLMNNPWEPVFIEGVALEIQVEYKNRVKRLRGVDVLDPVVKPGAPVRLALTLVPQYGPAERKIISFTAPSEFEGRELEIEIVPGYEATPELAAPEDLGQLLRNLQRDPAPRTVALRLRAQGQGLAYGSHVTGQLPSFALDVLRPQSSSRTPEPVSPARQLSFPLDDYLAGRDRVRVTLKSSAQTP